VLVAESLLQGADRASSKPEHFERFEIVYFLFQLDLICSPEQSRQRLSQFGVLDRYCVATDSPTVCAGFISEGDDKESLLDKLLDSLNACHVVLPWSTLGARLGTGRARLATMAQPDEHRVVTAVRADLAAMVSAAPLGEALATLAEVLAASIDGGRCSHCGQRITADPKELAGLSRELRAVLAELAAASVGEDDDLAAVLSRVSSPVRDSAQP
jgi:hypothetical protein